MSKQSKITVKRYLETKVKPDYKFLDNKLRYPLYYRITYKRKTTNVKSFTGLYLSKEVLQNLEENPSDFDQKVVNELDQLKIALQDIINKNPDIEIFDNDLILKIKNYFEDLNTSLLYLGWIKFDYNCGNDLDLIEKNNNDFNSIYSEFGSEAKFYQNQFYGVFNKQNTLLTNLYYIRKITGFNLETYIHKETLKVWYVISLILTEFNKPNRFIDFFINYDLKKLVKSNKKQNYPVTSNEIDYICKTLIYNHINKNIREAN
ncbi:hypothetical protein [Flavobacterium aestuarii]|uniref:hypothetical protein n=1 Tax=Flavobacterium aestuarii TaxID=3149227 RepID=UPI0032B4D569